MILACKDISKSYGTDIVLEKISFNLEEKEKAAIVGVNGAGKTTLFKIITDKISYDDGQIYIPKGTTVGYLEQNIDIRSEKTIYEEMLSVLKKYNVLTDMIYDGMLPEYSINDAQKGASYYFCRNDLSKYKRVVTNIATGYYRPPKLKCGN